jgi:hypothetical protein
MFVDEFLNGDPRIPYSADVSLHFMRHAPQVSRLRFATAAVPGEVDVAVFRDDELRGSLYVAMRADADSMQSRLGRAAARCFIARASCFDPDWNREIAFADTVPAAWLPERDAEGGRVYSIVRRLEIPFERFYVACALEDGEALARASARSDADAARFAGDRLVMSDVLLFDEADGGNAPAGGGTAGGVADAVERGGLRMRPRVGHRYGPGDRVHAYTEVYNLSTTGGECAYAIRFAIYPSSTGETSTWDVWRGWLSDLFGEDGEPAVSQRFERSGNAHRVAEHIAIDIDALEPGEYELVVEVTDRATGAQAVSHTPLRKWAPRVTERR